jgi:hypothetical protein
MGDVKFLRYKLAMRAALVYSSAYLKLPKELLKLIPAARHGGVLYTKYSS